MTQDHDHYDEEAIADELLSDPLHGLSLIRDSAESHTYSKHALLIPIDATHDSSLKFEKTTLCLEKAIKAGNQIVLDIDLGLFENTPLPLANKTQFLSLSIAIKHIVDTLYTPFERNIIGAILFRGDIIKGPSQDNPFHKENYTEYLKEYQLESSDYFDQYVLDAHMEYLGLIANLLPRKITPIIAVDAIQLSHTLLAKLFLKCSLQGIRLAHKNGLFETGAGQIDQLGAIHFSNSTQQGAAYGICFGSHLTNKLQKKADTFLAKLKEDHIPFKILSEEGLTSEWGGIETLVLVMDTIHPMTLRKLQGFQAASGNCLFLN